MAASCEVGDWPIRSFVVLSRVAHDQSESVVRIYYYRGASLMLRAVDRMNLLEYLHYLEAAPLNSQEPPRPRLNDWQLSFKSLGYMERARAASPSSPAAHARRADRDRPMADAAPPKRQRDSAPNTQLVAHEPRPVPPP
eukprot:scaffold175922_cov27-Tisochrysis_lutea.AAC.5